MRNVECFKIRLYASDTLDMTKLNMREVLFDLPCGGKFWTGNPVDIVADPFLFVSGDTLFLFYEFKRMNDKGVLAMVCTRDLASWSEPVVVLEEPFHLSYPWVFEEDGHIYMIPETCADHSIRIYEADNNNLTHFTFKQKIMSRENTEGIVIDYSDTSIFNQDGIYYLHTTANYNGINELELYTSLNLFGTYTRHPQSPIVKNMKSGRNGGCLLHLNTKLYRIAQDCMKRYGDNIHLFEVDEMTPFIYREHIVKEDLFDINSLFYKEGGHHLNVVEYKGKYIYSTDAKEYHKFILSKVIWKIRQVLHC